MAVSQRIQLAADANFYALGERRYPGRGIVVGLDETGSNLLVVYWIMGRSATSRNRVLTQADGRVHTEFADPEAAKGQDPSLVIYNALRQVRSALGRTIVIASNGAQTDAVAHGYMTSTSSIGESMRHFSYEPDAPHHTPRFTAVAHWANLVTATSSPVAYMSAVRRSPFSAECDRSLWELSLAPGLGYCIHTYRDDGEPLPAFRDEPYYVPVGGGLGHTASMFWNALNQDCRVALAAIRIPRDDGPPEVITINEFPKR
jgi:IMP cyclohydrolase